MSANIYLAVFTKKFSSHTGPGGLFKSKTKKNDQSIIMFLSNYDRNNFLSYFPFSDLITNCIWIERRNW